MRLSSSSGVKSSFDDPYVLIDSNKPPRMGVCYSTNPLSSWCSGGFPQDQSWLDDNFILHGVLLFDQVQQEGNPLVGHLWDRLADGGKRWINKGRQVNIIGTDQGYIFRYIEAYSRSARFAPMAIWSPAAKIAVKSWLRANKRSIAS